jgi:hypothetical protein
MPNQELQCPFCPKTSSRGTGLASHIRGAHPSQYAGWSRSRKGVTKARVQSSSKGTGITGGLKDAIEQLEAQRVAIERALAALREIDGIAPVAPAARRGRPPKAKRKGWLSPGRLSPEGRARLIAAQKKRWAGKKAAAASPATKKTPAKRGRPKKSA